MSEAAVKKLSKKRKSRLNLIDVVLIVLVVLALGIFLSYRFFIAGDNVHEVQLNYQIEVEGVGENLNTERLVGDLLYTNSGICLGKVAKCSEVMTKTNTVTSADNTVYKQTVRYVVVTLSADAIRNQKDYRIDGVLIEEGMRMTLSSNDFCVDGVCTEITEVTQ
ncbi:MAG: DUF4330 family protein [Ruminococcaceae bacterium]|nr:DUF4330 family protein [Oscillospiraceae bacterium]